jgi:dihydropteroate synthase-like protein
VRLLKLKVAIVTGRRASSFLRSIAATLSERTGWQVDVVEAPVEIASLMPKSVARRMVEKLDCKYDIVILPGTLPYTVDDIGGKCTLILKGPLDPADLLLLAELPSGEAVERLKRSRSITPELIIDRWLEELRNHHLSTPSIHICGARIPIRPPPVAVAAEVYVRQGAEEEAVEKAVGFSRSGADIIVVGFSASYPRDRALDVLRKIHDAVGGVAVDSPDKKLVARAVEEGYACLALSAGEGDPLFDLLPRGSPLVIIPVYRDYSTPSTARERVSLLQRLVSEARRRGLTPIADPLVDPPGFGFARSVEAYLLASEALDAPLMAGIANVYELIDADSHGQIAVLAQLYAEAGASILLVTEESRKTQRAVSEAAIAATMASISLLKRKPPKDMGLTLLYAKEKRAKPSREPVKPSKVYDAGVLASWHGFRMDRLGSHVIMVDKGVIRDFYTGRRGTIEVRGRTAEEVWKAIAYLGLASEPSHYAYLGCELCKAEQALRMGVSYEQEKPLLRHPAENAMVYSVREARAKSLRASHTHANTAA